MDEQELAKEEKPSKGRRSGPKPGIYVPFTKEEKEQVLCALDNRAQIYHDQGLPIPDAGKLLKSIILKMLL